MAMCFTIWFNFLSLTITSLIVIIIILNNSSSLLINKETPNLDVIQTIPTGALLTGRREKHVSLQCLFKDFPNIFFLKRAIPYCAGEIGSLEPQSHRD